MPASIPGIGQCGAGTTPGMTEDRGSLEPDGEGLWLTHPDELEGGVVELEKEAGAHPAMRTRLATAATKREEPWVVCIVETC